MKKSFFRTPEFLSLPIFGLSITQSSIKFFKLKKTKKGLIPDVFGTTKLSETCDIFKVTEEDPSYQNLFAELKKIKEENNITFAQVSVPEDQTYVFKALIPVEVLPTAKEFIINNMDQYIPLTTADVYFDYKVLLHRIKDGQVPVIVTAIPKFIVEKYAQLLESCGIFMVGCEPETHSVSHCVIHKKDKNPYIIMYVDHAGTKISVVEDRYVQYTQTLPVTSKDISGVITPETAKILKDTLNRVIIYWFTTKENQANLTKIENIILTGAGIDSPELINFFENNLAVNATHGNVWKNCFELSEYLPDISKQDSLKYAVCIGLSMFKIK